MRGLLARLTDDLWATMANPQADPRKAVVFIGAGVLLTLMVIVMLLYFIGGPPPGSRDAARSDGRRRGIRSAYLVWGLLLVLGGMLLAADQFATAPSTCARCHETAPSVVTHTLSNHAEVDCMSCHGGSGLTGAIATRARAAGNLVAHVVHARPDLSTSVANTECLGCHEEVTAGVRELRGIRVRHADFIQLGARCLDCHGAVGHSPKPGFLRRPTMDTCLSCHDGVTASTECKTCHTTDIAVAQGIPEGYPKVHLAEDRSCGGCHPLELCTACHGLEMPHTATFAEPEQHASLAAFDKKENVCYRCHTPDECLRCHQAFAAHGPDWKQQHGAGGRAAGEGCKNCHDKNTLKNYCDLCHTEQ